LGGRNDLIQFFPNGRCVVFELFVTVSQVPQDLRLLEQSDADVKIAILLDEEINSKLAKEYFRKKPNHFPYVWLSEVLMSERESKCLNRLREVIESQLASQPGIPFPGTSDKLKRFAEQTRELPVGVYQQLSILCRNFKNRLFYDSPRREAESRLRGWFDRHHLSLNRGIRDRVRSILNDVGRFPGWRSRAEPEAADYQRRIIDLLRDIEAAADEHTGRKP